MGKKQKSPRQYYWRGHVNQEVSTTTSFTWRQQAKQAGTQAVETRMAKDASKTWEPASATWKKLPPAPTNAHMIYVIN